MLEQLSYKTVEVPAEDARIVKSAWVIGEITYTHVRHPYARDGIVQLQIYDRLTIANGRQGFVDQYGNFFDRETAAKIAFKAKQIATDKKELFSEDIWYNDGSQIYQG